MENFFLASHAFLSFQVKLSCQSLLGSRLFEKEKPGKKHGNFSLGFSRRAQTLLAFLCFFLAFPYDIVQKSQESQEFYSRIIFQGIAGSFLQGNILFPNFLVISHPFSEDRAIIPFVGTDFFHIFTGGLYFSKALFEGFIFGGAYIRRGLSMEGNLRFKID